jgi:hypothetical protein
MLKQRKVFGSAVTSALLAAGVALPGPVQADGAGWFLGGMVTSKVLTNMERNTQAQEAQAYRSQPQPVQQAAPAPRPTTEQQLQDLDRLAAGGYITPEEYKARRQAILQRM